MTPHLWTMPDIAARLGVAHETVRSWLYRGQMPAPSGRVGQSPWWDAATIEPWMRQWEIDHEGYEGSGSDEDY